MRSGPLDSHRSWVSNGTRVEIAARPMTVSVLPESPAQSMSAGGDLHDGKADAMVQLETNHADRREVR